MFKSLKQHANALFSFKFWGDNKSFRGFTLIEVAFMVMIVTVIILPVVGAVNANSHNGEPTITETIERQQSIEQGMRSLMQRAINGKIIITHIDNPTTQFKLIDANTAGVSGDFYDLRQIYIPANTPRQARQGFFLFKVPIGVQNVNTKDLFKFRWTIKDASFEGTTSTTPDGLKKVGLLLEAFDAKASATDINGGTVNPLATQYGTTFYSETPVVTSASNTAVASSGVMINVDLNKSGCSERKRVDDGGGHLRRSWFYDPIGAQKTDCGDNTSMEPTEGIKTWYEEAFLNRNTDLTFSYLKAIDIGMQTMNDTAIEVPLTTMPTTFLSLLPTKTTDKSYYDNIINLPTTSYAYSATERSIQALKAGSYTQGAIIHIITSNLDTQNQINAPDKNNISLSPTLGVFSNPSIPTPSTDDLLNLVKAFRNTTNANGVDLKIRHYVVLHKGISNNTRDYFKKLTEETNGKFYLVSNGKTDMKALLGLIFKDISEIKKTNKSKTYRFSMD